MKRLLLKCTCDACGTVVKVPDTFIPNYGELLLRSDGDNNNLRLVTVDDQAWKELDDILVAHFGYSTFSVDKKITVFQKLFGIATCDPDENGAIFEIGRKKRCSNCGAKDISNCKETDPPEYIELSVPIVTHNYWNMLSEKEKIDRVRMLLSTIAS